MCMVEGYFDKMDRMAAIMRIASYRIHQTWAGKEAMNIHDYWPLFADKQQEKIEEDIVMDAEMYFLIKQAHGIA